MGSADSVSLCMLKKSLKFLQNMTAMTSPEPSLLASSFITKDWTPSFTFPIYPAFECTVKLRNLLIYAFTHREFFLLPAVLPAFGSLNSLFVCLQVSRLVHVSDGSNVANTVNALITRYRNPGLIY